MYTVSICNAKGIVLKKYSQDNIYVTACSINGGQITLDRVLKTESGSFTETTQEHIMSGTAETVGKNTISTVVTENYGKYVQVEWYFCPPFPWCLVMMCYCEVLRKAAALRFRHSVEGNLSRRLCCRASHKYCRRCFSFKTMPSALQWKRYTSEVTLPALSFMMSSCGRYRKSKAPMKVYTVPPANPSGQSPSLWTVSVRTAAVKAEEEAYFFKMSKYADRCD